MPVSMSHLTELLANKRKSEKMALFAKWPANRLYYVVTLIKLDHINKMTTVRFSDNSECDFVSSDLHMQFLEHNAYSESNEVLCCVCDGDETDKNNDIVICEICQQGYHQKCHDPKIHNSLLGPAHADDDWTCSTCDYMMIQLEKTSKPNSYSSTPKPVTHKSKKATAKPKTKAGKVVDKERPKAPAPVRVRLPAPPTKPKAKTVNKEPIKEQETESSADTSEGSSNTHLLKALDKVSIETEAEVHRAPASVARTAQALMTRDAPTVKTPDLVNALAQNKALELEEEDTSPGAIQAPEEDVASELPPKTKIVKTSTKKMIKKPVSGKAPRKHLPPPQKNTPAPA